MTQKRRNRSSEENNQKAPVPAEFWELQKLKIQNEAKEIELQEKEFDKNAELAEKSLEAQKEYLKSLPQEQRKFIRLIFSWAFAAVFLVLIFIGSLVFCGYQDFAWKFLQAMSYVIVSIGSFYAGRKSAKKKSIESTIEEAEIVD